MTTRCSDFADVLNIVSEMICLAGCIMQLLPSVARHLICNISAYRSHRRKAAVDDDHKRLRLTQWKQRYLGGGGGGGGGGLDSKKKKPKEEE